MSKIASVASSVPPHRVSQRAARKLAETVLCRNRPSLKRLLPVFENAGINHRYFSCPPQWFSRDHSPEERNQIYIESSTELSIRASRKALDRAGLEPVEIDYIIYINSTGLATPSIDSRLINLLGLKNDIRRTPVWGLGCAGGTAGISMAHHYLMGHPRDRVLLVAAELCGLTFLPDDFSRSNLVATALFGEGAAAVVMTGDEVDTKGLPVVATRSRLYPDSLDVMGWNVTGRGLQVVFARRIPDIVREHAREDILQFLSSNGKSLDDIQSYIVHPGGVKVMQAYESALGLANGALSISRDILRDYGNMSSVTVLFVLEKFMSGIGAGRPGDNGAVGLMTALGPGFSSESVLLKLA